MQQNEKGQIRNEDELMISRKKRKSIKKLRK